MLVTERASACAEALSLFLPVVGLLERRTDRAELGVEGAAEAIDHSNDRERDTGGDEAVFDRSSTRLILQKASCKLFHNVTPVDV